MARALELAIIVASCLLIGLNNKEPDDEQSISCISCLDPEVLLLYENGAVKLFCISCLTSWWQEMPVRDK